MVTKYNVPLTQVLTKAFHYEHLKTMTDDMVECSNDLVELMKGCVGGEPIDFFINIKKATMDVIGKTAFGYDFGCVKVTTGEAPAEATAFQYMLDEAGRRMGSLKPQDLFYKFPNATNKKHAEASKLLRGCIDMLVTKRIVSIICIF